MDRFRCSCWALTACFVAAWVLGVLAVSGAQADDGKRVVVRTFEGPRSAKVRDSVVESLSSEAEVVPSKDVQRAADKLSADPDSADGRVAIARELEIDAWVEGRVAKKGRNWTVTLSVASGADGEASEAGTVSARDPVALSRKAGSRAWDELSGAIGQASRPEPEREVVAKKAEPEPEEEPEEAVAKAEPEEDEPQEDEPQEDEPEGDDGELPMALGIELGLGGFTRDFEYRENLSALPTYDIGAPPFGRLALQWFPAAHFQDDALAHIGLRAEGQMAFGLSSGLADGNGGEFTTSSHLLEVGVRVRLPLGMFQVGGDVSYGMHKYAIDSASSAGGEIDPGIPAVDYAYVRLHVDVTAALGDNASIALGGGLLPLLGSGEVETWFPRSGGLAIEGNVTFAYGLFSSLDLMLSLTARRYAITLDPTVDDVNAGMRIAAGMVDQYVTGQLGLRFRLGGTP